MTDRLLDEYVRFKELTLSHRRFKHKDVLKLIGNCGFKNESVGKSYEGRDIRKIIIGSGKRKILLWSQMHGNEATATMAIFDILRFFRASGDEFDTFRNNILSELELHFVPMLNPDGAERFQRRTAQEIDMNRDAVALQCPESRILKSLVTDLKPEFSFNLHDQSIHYAAGQNPVQATIAFLATAYNKETEWNECRTKAMQVICKMNEVLQKTIPGRVGRFSDEFEPRAFGDNIQKWGSSLILIESGGYPNDPEKQYIRALNYNIILEALFSIAKEDYKRFSQNQYEAILQNNRVFMDLKITNLQVESIGREGYKVDVGIILDEKNNKKATDFTLNSVIEEIGDLSVFYGIETFDAKGGKFRSVAKYPDLIKKHKIKLYPKLLTTDQQATFVIDHGESQTLILNGKIV